VTQQLDDDARYTAVTTRDRRFDGVFFVAVSTTGIYCRPICPARTPGRTRCSFYDSAAQAETAGFRACFRCRPELAPGNADVDAVDRLVATATARIAEGALNDGSVDDLATELGVSARHLRRSIEGRLGVTPIALAQTRRLALAKQLLQDTALPLTDIAFAAGYGSVRRFNAVFAEVMGSAPGELRRKHADTVATGELLELRLDYRPPYDWDAILAFLGARAIPGVEQVRDGRYRRVVHLDDTAGVIEVRPARDRDALVLAIEPVLVRVVMPLVARVRRMFDLDARPDVIGSVLRRDPLLARLVAQRPGLRVPGAIDGFEAAIRAMLGQQVSVAAATTLAGRFAAAFGTPLASPRDGLAARFPTAAVVVAAGTTKIRAIGLPAARADAIHGLASAIASGTLRLDGPDLDRFVADATALAGIGPWTAHYLALRALHLPDAFPAGDLGIRKALGGSPRDAEARAEAWRPFRSYAVIQLWTSLGASHVDDDDDRLTARTATTRRTSRRGRGAVSAGAARTRGANRPHATARARRRPARRVLRR
jgi:AraC family transcriptional regulator of adaptative response / DNA-3-methyladenine glycosylase II